MSADDPIRQVLALQRQAPPVVGIGAADDDSWEVIGALNAMQLATVARKDDAGSRSLRAVLKSGATAANGATRVRGTSYVVDDARFEVDPATDAAWTKAAVDGMQAGTEVVA